MKNYVKCILACLIAAFSLTSCNDDNNDHSLTPEEINSIINGFRGYYQGKMISASDYNAETKKFLHNDTTMTQVTISLDTTVAFAEFPLDFLAKKLKNANNSSLKEALETAGIANASGKFTPAGINPLSIFINYLNFPLEYGGQQHTVTLSFLQYFSLAQIINSKVMMQLLPASVYVDGKLAEDLIQSSQSVDLIYYFNQI